ncbi:uncharacterized protein LOC129358894 [Poeciliopsis prolifica]|uniref:uncharacterized protein LOC129358894 n=1 Tax=Poeciliopsis prolifica TaxID=188132 RepID=UPI0024137693|nr:uncharacterized protein LOC129358894 [Poeciliopsis prolifica]
MPARKEKNAPRGSTANQPGTKHTRSDTDDELMAAAEQHSPMPRHHYLDEQTGVELEANEDLGNNSPGHPGSPVAGEGCDDGSDQLHKRRRKQLHRVLHDPSDLEDEELISFLGAARLRRFANAVAKYLEASDQEYDDAPDWDLGMFIKAPCTKAPDPQRTQGPDPEKYYRKTTSYYDANLQTYSHAYLYRWTAPLAQLAGSSSPSGNPWQNPQQESTPGNHGDISGFLATSWICRGEDNRGGHVQRHAGPAMLLQEVAADWFRSRPTAVDGRSRIQPRSVEDEPIRRLAAAGQSDSRLEAPCPSVRTNR